ncbi:MAG: BglG family transcription antiterminator LicT [Suipraeoptans sp.]
MKVTKVINNNIISSLDERGREIVVMGKGLGFGQKSGSIIDESMVEKIFRMDTQREMRQFEDLLYDVPLEIVQLTTTIISNAKNHIPGKLQKSIYLTLIDHINYAKERQKQNIQFHNPLLYDIKRLYKTEYKVGEDAVEMINETLGTDLPKDEAASIALHFINAGLGYELPETINVAKIIQNTIKIVQYHYNIEIQDDTPQAEYFLSYLKFFAQRVVTGEMHSDKDDAIEQLIIERYEKSYSCTTKIASFIKKEYHITISQSEMIDLTVQIERITKN